MTLRAQFIENTYDIKLKDVYNGTSPSNSILMNIQNITVKQSGFQKKLWLHGVDKYGFSVEVQVLDFSPSFLIQTDLKYDSELSNYIDNINRTLLSDKEKQRLENMFEKQQKNGVNCIEDIPLPDEMKKIKSARIKELIPFIGFTNLRKDKLIEIFCSGFYEFSLLQKYFAKKEMKIYHEDFEPSNQFLLQKNVKYYDWIEIENFRKISNFSSQQTSANVEGQCRMIQILKYDQPVLNPKTGIPLKVAPTLKAFIRIKACSKDGVKDRKFLYKANPENPYDRIVAFGIYCSWSDEKIPDQDINPFYSKIFTLLPEGDPNISEYLETRPQKQTLVEYCDTEEDILHKVRNTLVSDLDAEDIFYFPDIYDDTMSYFINRALFYDEKHESLKIDRYNVMPIISKDEETHSKNMRAETRNLCNIETALKKKVFVQIESYDLYTCSLSKVFRKNPPNPKTFLNDPELVNKNIVMGNRAKIIESLVQDIELLMLLERDTSMRLEFQSIGQITNISLTDAMQRGEQTRVYRLLQHFCTENKRYINREKLSQRCLRFDIKTNPPTFKDPPELKLNLDLRSQCQEELTKLKNYHQTERKKKSTKKQILDPKKGINYLVKQRQQNNEEDHDEEKKLGQKLQEYNQFDVKDEEEDEEEEIAEGGNVVKPAAKYWGNEKICVFDFASLYPSIMQAYDIGYDTLVFDEEYLNLPNVTYYTIPINASETVIYAHIDNEPGIMARILKLLVAERKKVKKLMEETADPFLKNLLDIQQNSLKVICNALYGFCGASKRGAILAIKEVMYTVTAIGRYLQKTCTSYIGRNFGVPVIYGDTDSIFPLLLYPLRDKINEQTFDSMSIEEMCELFRQHYKMDEFFTIQKVKHEFTWENVVKYYLNEVPLDRKNPEKGYLDIRPFIKDHQLRAIMSLVAIRLCHVLTSLFLAPVKLEFENMAVRCFMGDTKKTYCYLLVDPDNPSKIKKTKVTGMASKKRDWCHWTRKILNEVTDCLSYDKLDKIVPMLTRELDRLVNGQVSVHELKVSRLFKYHSYYKKDQVIHYQVVKKIEERTRMPFRAQTRMYFVVLEGKEKIFLRAETPEFAQGKHLDYEYYILNQLLEPLRKMLVYHPQVVDINQFIQPYLLKVQNKRNGKVDIMSAFAQYRQKRQENSQDFMTMFKKIKTE